MEVSRDIVITYDHKDRKDYIEMINRLIISKPVGFKQYIELTKQDVFLLQKMKKALTIFDDPKNIEI